MPFIKDFSKLGVVISLLPINLVLRKMFPFLSSVSKMFSSLVIWNDLLLG